MAVNYEDVLHQLRAAGLIVDTLETNRSKPKRCRVEGDRELRGWYSLHEVISRTGETTIIGSFGEWRGDNNNAQRVDTKKSEFSPEQRESFKRILAEDRKRINAIAKADAKKAADLAARTWSKCDPNGDSEYLTRKCVQPHGLRFSPSGALVVPMTDAAGSIHGLQIIRTRALAKENHAPEKQYWPTGMSKKGHFHLIGLPTWIVLVAEGYATAASLHEATTLPTAVAFDAGNIAPVVAELHKRYPRAKVLICADDDNLAKCQHCRARIVIDENPKQCPACEKEHGRQNTGVMSASAAAAEVNGSWIKPRFADEDARRGTFIERGTKLTDFNDVHVTQSLHEVREQIHAQLTALRWNAEQFSRASTTGTEGAGAELRPIETTDQLLKRFTLVYAQKGTVFDSQEHMLVSLSDMRDLCVSKHSHRAWMESPNRRVARVDDVGFDPAGDDSRIKCNLWGGWPTRPIAGCCDHLLEVLRHMCSADKAPEKLYQWVLKWLAFPIQHPGAKMKTTIVVHGPQGTGKNMFFEAIMSIYGEYADVIDQAAVEDRFNDWASRKLFMIADEVVARNDLYHIKNKLKTLISGNRIRINPKNFGAYWESNHVNMVFLSNESIPVVLEEDDRRHGVVWTPKKFAPEFYSALLAEMRVGGVAALHDYLLNIDLGDFSEGTLPPMTDAKAELIQQSLDSTSRFYYALVEEEIGIVKFAPALTQDVYDLYRLWCARTGERPAPMKRLVNVFMRKHEVHCERKRWTDEFVTQGPHSIAMFLTTPPENVKEADWLGNCVLAFKDALKDFRGSA